MIKSKLNEHFKKVMTYKNIDFFDINHSIERFYDRVSGNIILYNTLVKKGIDYIIRSGKKSNEDRYIFMSKLHGFGIQVDYRQDRKTGKFACYSATTLSKNEMKFFTKKDKQLFLENIIKTGNDVRLLNEGYYKFDFIDNNDLSEELLYCGYSLYIVSGKIETDFVIVAL